MPLAQGKNKSRDESVDGKWVNIILSHHNDWVQALSI